jgi:hypothetical protein
VIPALGHAGLHLRHVLVELRALFGGEDLAYGGDPLVESLLHLGATSGHASGIAALAAGTRSRRLVLPACTIRVEVAARALAELRQLLLLVRRKRDAAEEHALRPAATATEGTVVLRAIGPRGAVLPIHALRAGGGGEGERERQRRRQRLAMHDRVLEC